jgi:cold shock CspA family protein
MQRGRLRAWYRERSFGFIKPDRPLHRDPNLRRPEVPDIFVHADQIKEGRPYTRARVSYEVAIDGRNGKAHAIGVKILKSELQDGAAED